MAWTPFQLGIAFLMLITGSINTLIAKWTDMLKAEGRDHGEPREFNHPFLQACAMFLGEFLCIVAYGVIHLINRARRQSGGELEAAERPLGEGQEHFTWRKAFVFLPPALCDMTATSIMYVGLNMTYASSFQMLRGAVIIFTALLSVAFLRNRLSASKWLGMFVVLAGLALVGVSDIVFGKKTDAHGTNQIITGDLLIIMAQIVAACQMVYEEKYLSKYDVPALVAVGCEGLFGFVVLSLLLIPMSYIPAGSFSDTPFHTIEDPIDAFVQMSNNKFIVLGLVGTIFSIAFFNYAGISVTKEINATTRMVLDSLRTLIIWAVSLGLKWQDFQYLQVVGFVLLIIGMTVYNQIVTTETFKKIKIKILRRSNGDEEVLVTEEEVDRR
ncbi:solute carrier family 35 member F6-like [Paramacrobiotus metropolitanus]|uniref:solute carrier family 35 member F6-like n=1 Tax=Paramacrobiotus metropolitanus TaxID=2943436 RepID=UPI002445D257|nr:solute carrier family 35 member F6-like [Paramacrobiotus metropolitanus]